MTTTLPSFSFILSGLAIAVVLALTLPSFVHAANYAYVNTSNNVSMVVADSWMSAIETAPNIHARSGVMLLNTQNSDILNSN